MTTDISFLRLVLFSETVSVKTPHHMYVNMILFVLPPLESYKTSATAICGSASCEDMLDRPSRCGRSLLEDLAQDNRKDNELPNVR